MASGSSAELICSRDREPGAELIKKVPSVDQRMCPECGVGFRQQRPCRRTRPGQLCAKRRPTAREGEQYRLSRPLQDPPGRQHRVYELPVMRATIVAMMLIAAVMY